MELEGCPARVTRRIVTYPLVGLIAVLLGCGDDTTTPPEPETAPVAITTETSGAPIDADGYLVQVEGHAPMPIGANAELIVSGVETGSRVVTLSAVAENCCVQGANPRSVTVAAGDTARTTFEIVCAAPAIGTIAFETARDGNFEIYSMNADGTGLVNLTSHPSDDTEPAWSPDGTKIVFTSERAGDEDIFVMDADGSNVVRLTDSTADDASPAWSPDGTQIVFDTDRDGNTEVYVMSADGSNQTNLTQDTAGDFSPDWSIDGVIVFASNRDGQVDVFRMDDDGQNPTNLTNHPANEQAPAWSPDGTQVAFRSNRDGTTDVYVMNADGSGVQRITVHPETDSFPSWSPDGTQLVFRSDRNGDPDVYRINLDGTCAFNLMEVEGGGDGVTDCHPDWRE